jgi:alpha-amylase/alpha-mannosidase (GH57 family)
MSAAPARLPVVLLWHMHQPHYRDALSGEYVLPWTYLHAIKDYSDMAAHLEQVPGARAVVNFTPVLIEQLQDYAARLAQHRRTGADVGDRVLATLTEAPLPAHPVARTELARALLRAQRRNMIEPFPHYEAAARVAESLAKHEHGVWIADQLLRDLGVWYHIAWLGETVRRGDARVRALADKGCGFDAADRAALLALVADVIAGILPRYRALGADGRVELSVTPYAHPILPLLLDFRAARESLPASRLPTHARYPGGEQRCHWHMAEAVRVFTEAFGFAPRGCWPSEGAVSDRALEAIDRFGFRWAATSSNVLRASLGEQADDPGAFDVAYRLPGQRLASFYRHDMVSDLVGFEYSTWHGDDAAANLVEQLLRLADRHQPRDGHCVLVALDGENAWEHYPFNGFFFLRRAYELLARHPRIELTTLSAFLDRDPPTLPLAHVVAGSWVHGTLSTWMGDPAKNAGWDLLCEAKAAFDRAVASGALAGERLRRAERQLALCESSDWFWWFGDYNPADAVTQFDRLFRRQLANLYHLVGEAAPAALDRPISVGHGAPEHGGVMRRADAG